MDRHRPPGTLTEFTCPECGGSIWEQSAGGPPVFECRVGHLYSSGAMLLEHAASLEAAIWTALRLTTEHAAVHRRLAEIARQRGRGRAAEHLELEADQVAREAAHLRRLLGHSDRAS